MIVIDKRKNELRIIATVTEKALGNSTGFKLQAYSAFTNKSYSILLPENTSNHRSRFDEFIVPTQPEIGKWETGVYSYSIIEMNGDEELKTVETGVLQVIDGVTEYVSLEPDETEDDYIVYKNN